MKKEIYLYKFHPHSKPISFIGGVFYATPEEILSSIGKVAIFPNVLGNGNDIHHTLNERDFSIVQKHNVEGILIVSTDYNPMGFNPLEYIQKETGL